MITIRASDEARPRVTAEGGPGGPGAEHFSANTERRPGDQTHIPQFARDNRALMHPTIRQFYLIQPLDRGGGILNWDLVRRLITPVAP
jgi:hypothetical protein